MEEILGYSAEEWLSSPTFWNDHIYVEDKESIIDFCQFKTKQKEQTGLNTVSSCTETNQSIRMNKYKYYVLCKLSAVLYVYYFYLFFLSFLLLLV